MQLTILPLKMYPINELLGKTILIAFVRPKPLPVYLGAILKGGALSTVVRLLSQAVLYVAEIEFM